MLTRQDSFFVKLYHDEQNVDQLISDFPNQKLIPTLVELYQQYQYHRRVKGDGNCFYRSFAFLYLLNRSLNNFQILFPKAPIIDCENLPFDINSEQKAYQLLSKLWTKLIKPLDSRNKSQRSKQLRIIFNEYKYVDEFLVAYFRSLTYQYIMKHRKSLQAFVQQQFEVKSAKILKYSQQAQFFQILNLSNCLNIRFTIMMAHQVTLKKITINQHLNDNYLFFLRPGHYEILCTQDEYKNEREQMKDKSVNTKFLQLELKFKNRKSSYDEKKINNIEEMKQLLRQNDFKENMLYHQDKKYSNLSPQKSYDQSHFSKNPSSGTYKNDNSSKKLDIKPIRKSFIGSTTKDFQAKDNKKSKITSIPKKQINIQGIMWIGAIFTIIGLAFFNNNIS